MTLSRLSFGSNLAASTTPGLAALDLIAAPDKPAAKFER
jgi:hypothetical protein